MGNDTPQWTERASGAPADRLYVDGPGCTPAAVVGQFLATSAVCSSRTEDTDGKPLYCNKETGHVAMGDPWHNMVPRLDERQLPDEGELARRIFADDGEDQEDEGEPLIRPVTGFDLYAMRKYLPEG